MTETKKILLTAALTGMIAGCVTDASELDSTDTVTEELTQAVQVPVGNPITMVAAPYVTVNATVGDVINFTAVAPPCPTTCGVTWRDPDRGIARYGGMILGYGASLSVTPSVAGNSRVTLEYCQKTSGRFSRCIYTYVYITTN